MHLMFVRTGASKIASIPPDGSQVSISMLKTHFSFCAQVINGAFVAVLYQSSSLHRVTPVTEGQRIAAITWIQSLVPNSHIRDTLHALDQSIQTLLQNPHIERGELNKLHHIYHNLIRQNTVI
jgi:PKHD-type hydroxylase